MYLKIQPYRQTTLSNQTFNKHSTKYYGPYQVIQRIGNVAYKFSLPTHVAVQNTFHVSKLKACYAFSQVLNHPPLVDIASPYCVEPDQVLDRKMIKRGDTVVAEILVQWKDIPYEQATWKDFAKIKFRFPTFLLCGQERFLRREEYYNFYIVNSEVVVN